MAKTTVTESGNTYAQHGRDLHEFIEALELDSVVLMGWSLGVFDAYAYMDEFGTDRVEAFVAVDESPRIIKADDQDWGEDSADGVAELLQLVGSENYLPFFSDYMAAGFVSPPDAETGTSFYPAGGQSECGSGCCPSCRRRQPRLLPPRQPDQRHHASATGFARGLESIGAEMDSKASA